MHNKNGYAIASLCYVYTYVACFVLTYDAIIFYVYMSENV